MIFSEVVIEFKVVRRNHYEELFETRPNLFAYVPLAVGDISAGFAHVAPDEEKFILSVGKSNRDYDFLVQALGTENYPVKIICDSYKNEHLPNHIIVIFL